MGNGSFRTFAQFFAVWLLLSGAAARADISVSSSVDRKVAGLDEIVTLSISIEGTQDVPAPAIPVIDGLSVNYLGPQTQFSFVNGKVSSSVTHVYSMKPLKTGQITIPEIEVKYNGNTARTQPVTIEVIEGGRRDKNGNGIGLSNAVFLRLSIEKKEPYLNEVFPVRVTLLSRGMPVRNIQFPQVTAPGLSLKPFQDAEQGREVISGEAYNTVEFVTPAYATRAGDIVVGPATLKCNLLVKRNRKSGGSLFDDFFSDNFFGGYQRYPLSLESDSVTLSIREMPEQGKPPDFTGAVGEFSLSVTANPLELSVGDPITLRMSVTGDGNMDTVNCPALRRADGFKIYDPQVSTSGKTKVFERVLIPEKEDLDHVPQALFSFFNPLTGHYEALASDPIPIRVSRARGEKTLEIMAAPAGEKSAEVLGKDIVYIKDTTGTVTFGQRRLYAGRFFIGLQFLPLAAFLASVIYRKKRERLATDIAYARARRAPVEARRGLNTAAKLLKHGKTEEFFDTLCRLLQSYLGDRFGLPSASITRQTLDDEPALNSLPPAILEKLKVCFDRCDAMRFSSIEPRRPEMEEILETAAEAVSGIENKGR